MRAALASSVPRSAAGDDPPDLIGWTCGETQGARHRIDDRARQGRRAESLLTAGHEVVVHARSTQRAQDLGSLAGAAAGVVIGDLSELDDVHRLAEQANALARSTP